MEQEDKQDGGKGMVGSGRGLFQNIVTCPGFRD
jgi:hypothetical protein